MPKYTCPRCEYTFKQRGDIRRHFLRKRICKVIGENIEINQCFQRVLGEKSQELIKMTPIDSSKLKNDSKMTPSSKKMTPIDSSELKNDSKMTPPSKKMTPIDSQLTPTDSKMTPIDLEMIFLKNSTTNSTTKKYICEFCKHEYSKNSNLHRHIKKCKKNENNLIKHMSKQIKNLEKEKESMRRQHALEVKDLLSKVGNVTNITNNTQQNIFINSYGDENLKYLTNKYLTNLIKAPFGAVPKLIKDIHFHKEHQENRNIKITNRKLPYASIFKDQKWNLYNKKDVIETIVDAGYNILDFQYEKDKDELSIIQNGRFKDFQKKYENPNNKLKKQLAKDTELTILNESKYILKDN